MLRFSSHSKLEKIAKPVLAIVEQKISHDCSGRVHWQGTSWPARFFQPDCQETILPSELVKVISVQDITLLVMPLNASLETKWKSAINLDGFWN